MLADFAEVVQKGTRDEMLLASIDWERLPRHVAIIMDGNGRWAAGRGQPRIAGHRAGVEAVRASDSERSRSTPSRPRTGNARVLRLTR